MIGAIIGDIVGSRFEFDNIKTKDFELFHPSCEFTDDSVMSLAIAKALLDCRGDYSRLGDLTVKFMQSFGKLYPDCSYGVMFRNWLNSKTPAPYDSFGNGAPMRVSACGFAANSLDETISLSRMVTEVTHNHPEGVKGAEATAVSVFLARTGVKIPELRDYINKRYYPMDFSLDEIRDSYSFNETSQNTVPQAIMAFLESSDFEDAIRNAISIGGDSDTLAAITGAVAEAYYGTPVDVRKSALSYLDERLLKVLREFESSFPSGA
jgi:type I restriction enzyme M protein